jgi:hypothetical protein
MGFHGKSKESQDLVADILARGQNFSAYDIMSIALEESPESDGNKAFAVRQRISAACSELHALGRIHCVDRKTNPASGEDVQVYRLNRDPKAECGCGHCPNGGKGYKQRYTTLLEERAKEREELLEQIETLIMFNDKKDEKIEQLEERLANFRGCNP